MPKAPPRERRPPDRTYRTYAHVRAFDAACPKCGTLASFDVRALPRFGRTGTTRAGYNTLTGVWTCRYCHVSWYVGVLLWPRLPGTPARPEDHSPTIEESSELRLLGGHVKGRDEAIGGRARVNRVCLCGVPCPMHGEGAEGAEGGDDGEG